MRRRCGPVLANSYLPRDSQLLALSGHFRLARRMSAFMGKEDIFDARSDVRQ